MTLSDPGTVMARLAAIENDLAQRQNELERAASAFFLAKRDRERERATAFLSADGTVAERSAVADQETAMMGAEDEAAYESLRAACRVLDTRASIGMALLKAQSR